MRLFLFNEITPELISIEEIIQALEKTIREYKNIKEQYPDIIDGIVTSLYLDKFKITKDITLSDCVKGITSKEIRGYSYLLFQKYPVDNYTDVDIVIDEEIDYHFLINKKKEDALTIKAASNIGGVLFSLNLHNDLAKNTLSIKGSDNSTFNIDNLFGENINTKYIESQICKEVESKLGNLERLELILDKTINSGKFIKEFEKVSKDIQDAIIEGFRFIVECKNNDTNIDETLLKDVTPDKEKKISLKELKLGKPFLKRVYFTEIDNIYYIASLERKPLKDGKSIEQDIHIKSALSLIKQLIILS
jgi:hypothetical protein